MITTTDAWRAAYPDAHAGILVMRGVANPATHPRLQSVKQDLEAQLRSRFAGQDRAALETYTAIPAYNAYYKQFRKTYAVQAQLESVVFKGKPIPTVAALVEAMFMAEIKNVLLTAGHDLDQVQLPVTLTVATGSERYTLLRGQEQQLKPGDMLMADRAGVIASVIHGPDQRTRIGAETRNVLFVVYAPAGIEASTVRTHVQDIRDYVLIVSPNATVETLEVLGGSVGEDRVIADGIPCT